MDGTELARPQISARIVESPGWIAVDDARLLAMNRRRALFRRHQERDRRCLSEGRNHAVSHDRWRAFAGGTKISDQRHHGGMRMTRGPAFGPVCGAHAEHRSDPLAKPKGEDTSSKFEG